MALNPRTLVIGAGWMAFGIAIYLLYRRSQGILRSDPQGAPAGGARGEEIEYESILVAFDDGEPFPRDGCDGGSSSPPSAGAAFTS